MMKTTHTLQAQPSVKVRIAGLEDLERIDPLIEIEFTYLPGYPPSYDASRGGPGGWDPGEGPELELVSAKLLDGDGTEPDADRVRDWATDWLHDEGYHAACRMAETDRAERVGSFRIEP